LSSPNFASEICDRVADAAIRGTRLAAIDVLAHQLVTDHLATRFESSAAWSRPGMSDIAEADADAIVARANHLMAIVSDAFRKSEAQR
jgi:hypothetical protein